MQRFVRERISPEDIFKTPGVRFSSHIQKWWPQFFYSVEKKETLNLPIEFFYNSFTAKPWQNPASNDGEEQNKKLSLVGIEPRTS